MIDGPSVVEVLAYARAGGSRSYDRIGFRVQSCLPGFGAFMLQTLAGERADSQHGSEKSERLKELRRGLLHLSFGFEFPEGRVRFEMTRRAVCFMWDHGDKQVKRWVSLADPPAVLLDQAKDGDAPPLLAHHVRLDDSDIWWLPYSELLAQGRFARMQEGVTALSDVLDPRCFYIFVSHRWLDPNQPDPSGRQAALVAWQTLGHLVNALWVGAARGLHAPRKRSPIGGGYVGVSGSELAESILVNLLRHLPEGEFAALVTEAEQFDDVVGDFGAGLALGDIGLQRLRARLQKAPSIREVLGRFRLWYDYSCMPQHPRTADEQKRFEIILNRLGAIQALGRTAVLLGGVERYFSRGWCSYESSLAGEHLSDTMDVWQGGDEVAVGFPSREEAFRSVLVDRPQLIWRGILDTEVFGVQSPDECMSRLELETTRPEDRDIVYQLLRGLGPPRSIHNDDTEVLTGVFPLPVQRGQAVIVAESGHALERGAPPEVSSVDAADANALAFVGPEGLPPFEAFDGRGAPGRRSAHVAIFGRCEGEAILYARWVRENRYALANALGVDLGSLSWVSSDVAPVGHFAFGNLTLRAVQSDVWIVMGSSASLRNGYTSRLLTESLSAAGIEYFEFETDTTEGNLRRHAAVRGAPPERRKPLRRLDLDDPALTTHAGGLFRPQLMQSLGARP